MHNLLAALLPCHWGTGSYLTKKWHFTPSSSLDIWTNNILLLLSLPLIFIVMLSTAHPTSWRNIRDELIGKILLSLFPSDETSSSLLGDFSLQSSCVCSFLYSFHQTFSGQKRGPGTLKHKRGPGRSLQLTFLSSRHQCFPAPLFRFSLCVLHFHPLCPGYQQLCIPLPHVL